MNTFSTENTMELQVWIKREESDAIHVKQYSNYYNEDSLSSLDHKDIESCVICFDIPRFPIVFGECTTPHMVCIKCYILLFKTQLEKDEDLGSCIKCPICRICVDNMKFITLLEIQLIHPNSSLIEFYSRTSTSCQNSGCPETNIKLVNISQHEFLLCSYRIIRCPALYCNVTLPANQMEDHLTECQCLRVNCKRCSS